MTRDPQPVHRKSSTSLEAENRSRPILDGIITQSEILAVPDDSISICNHPDVIVATSETGNIQFPDVIVRAVSGSTDNSYDELETPLSEDPPHRQARVRFRSRVRITSGLHRQRTTSHSEQDYLTFSSSSSISGSPSSSISAPLRTQAEDEVGKPGWGTLGQRVSILARGGRQRKDLHEQREGALMAKPISYSVANDANLNEQTPLTSLLLHGDLTNYDAIGPSADETDLSRDIDLVFGPWPNRLINHHWWWWKIEPVVCCHCLVESDDEG